MFHVFPLLPDNSSPAPGLTLLEAFTWIMALSGRSYALIRTGRVMHLVSSDPNPQEPEFISSETTDLAARRHIMEQVCAHGLGRFRVVSDELPLPQDGPQQ